MASFDTLAAKSLARGSFISMTFTQTLMSEERISGNAEYSQL
jgi:hypothetical protein